MQRNKKWKRNDHDEDHDDDGGGDNVDDHYETS